MARQKWQCWRGLALLIINENWTFPPTCYLLPSQGDITLLAISLSDIRYPHHSSEIFPSVGPISQDSPPHLCHSVIRMLVQHSHMTGPEWRRKTITDGHYFCIGRFDQYVLQHWVLLWLVSPEGREYDAWIIAGSQSGLSCPSLGNWLLCTTQLGPVTYKQKTELFQQHESELVERSQELPCNHQLWQNYLPLALGPALTIDILTSPIINTKNSNKNANVSPLTFNSEQHVKVVPLALVWHLRGTFRKFLVLRGVALSHCFFLLPEIGLITFITILLWWDSQNRDQ